MRFHSSGLSITTSEEWDVFGYNYIKEYANELVPNLYPIDVYLQAFESEFPHLGLSIAAASLHVGFSFMESFP